MAQLEEPKPVDLQKIRRKKIAEFLYWRANKYFIT